MAPTEGKLGMPQITPPMTGRPAAPAASKEPIHAKTNDTGAPKSQIPVQQLRQVIQELRNIPLNLDERKPVPKPAVKPAPSEKPVVRAPGAPRHAFVPVERFDTSILTIRAMHGTLNIVQTGNEKAGTYESQSRAAAESLAGACDSIQAALLAVDEKLFQVN
jgi:hypothetical protein